mgnify:CR=1 FL=1
MDPDPAELLSQEGVDAAEAGDDPDNLVRIGELSRRTGVSDHTLRAWESEDYCRQRLGLDAPLGRIDPEKINPVGSSLATGHPFAATGARIVATVAKQLAERGGGRALVSICTAGGMGVVAIVER